MAVSCVTTLQEYTPHGWKEVNMFKELNANDGETKQRANSQSIEYSI